MSAFLHLFYIHILFFIFTFLFNLKAKVVTHMTHISVYAAFRPIFMTHIVTHIVTHIAFVTHIVTVFCNISTFTVYPTSKNSSLF